jgi:hypothetical protein
MFTTLAWRVCRVADLLAAERNGPWLGLPDATRAVEGDPGTAAEALDALDEACGIWRGILGRTTEESLGLPVGRRGVERDRRSLVLHVLDELIHHGTEAALMRDLYAASRLWSRRAGPLCSDAVRS